MKRFFRAHNACSGCARLPHLIGLALLAFPLWAGENVVLTNGFRLHAERHETEGSTVRIYSGNGEVDMPAGSVAGYEQDELVPAPAAASAPLTHGNAAPLPTPATMVPKPPTPADLANAAAKKYN